MTFVSDNGSFAAKQISKNNGTSLAVKFGSRLRSKFNIAFLAICFVLFAVMFSFVGNSLLVWLLMAFLLILAVGEVLIRNVPRSILNRAVENCIRMDGSWSRGRQSVERVSLSRLKGNLVFVMFLCVAPSLFGLWVFNREVIPLGLGVDAMSSIKFDSDQWKAQLGDQERQFDEWQRTTAASKGMSAQQHKKLLWFTWPAIVALALMWIGVMALVISRYYVYCMRKYHQSVYSRASDYRWRDLSRNDFSDRQLATGAVSNTPQVS